MFLAERMDRVTFLVLKTHTDAVLDEIARAGVMQPARIEEMESWAAGLRLTASTRSVAEWVSMEQRVAYLLGDRIGECRAPMSAGGWAAGVEAVEEIEAALEHVEAELLPLMTARTAAETRLAEKQAVRARHGALLGSGIPLSDLRRSRYLTSMAGTVDAKDLGVLETAVGEIPALVVPYEAGRKERRVLCVALQKDRERLEEALKATSFREGPGSEELSKLVEVSREDGEITCLEKECTALALRVEESRESLMPELVTLMEKVEAALLLARIREFTRGTGQSCILTGWVPARRVWNLVAAVQARVGGHAVIEVVSAEEVDRALDGKANVPVLFDHAAFLKPFEWVVEIYGTPSYRMIDPTVISFIAFLIMFGMMFGDIGHGGVLVLAGLVLGAKAPAWRMLSKTLVYCGGTASAFGLLFGSVFGVETLVPPLWVNPVEGIDVVFGAAILFGMVLLSCGIVLHTINAVRTHTLGRKCLDRAGPLGGLIYWLGIVIVARLVASSMDVASLGIELSAFLALLGLFFIKEPMIRLLHRERPLFPGGVTTCLVEGTVEVLELLMGYLANTLSFIRVAAFGLAHVGLLAAVFGISDLASQWPAGTVLSALILVLGNVVVIVFEGAVVTIQILRLQYYEFFSKFFDEFGVKYSPVRYAGVCTDGP